MNYTNLPSQKAGTSKNLDCQAELLIVIKRQPPQKNEIS